MRLSLYAAGRRADLHESPYGRTSPRRRRGPASCRRRGRAADARRGRQRARGDGRHGGDDRGRLPAHERHRRRRLLARPRAVRPRALHRGVRLRRRGATIERYREHGYDAIPPRGPLAALTVPGAVGGWMLALRGGQASAADCRSTYCSVRAIRHARDGYHSLAQPGAAHRRETRRADGRAGLCRNVSGRRQAARPPARTQAGARSPRRSIIWPMPGLTTSTAATSAARSPPTWSASARPVTRADLESYEAMLRRAASRRGSTPARSTTRRRPPRGSPR